MLGIIATVFAVVGLWSFGRTDGSVDEMIVRLVAIIVLIASAGFVYWKKIVEIPVRWHNENVQIIAGLRASQLSEGLEGRIEQVITGEGRDDRGAAVGLSVLLNVEIRNLGSPTVADQWTVRLVLPDETEHLGRNTLVPGNISFRNEGQIMSFGSADMIYHKTLDPIPTGGLIRGWIYVVFPQVKRADIVVGSVFRLRFEDVRRKPYFAEQRIGGNRTDLRYYPGSGGGVRPAQTSEEEGAA